MEPELPAPSGVSKLSSNDNELPPTPLSILVIGDDPAYWETLRHEFETTTAEFGFLNSSSLALLRHRAMLPHIVLILVPLPGGAASTIHDLRSIAPGSRLIMLSEEHHINAESLLAAFAAGAHGWLPTALSTAALWRTMMAIHAGELGLSRRHMGMVVSSLRAPDAHLRDHGSTSTMLTPRERQVLSAVAQLESTNEISHALGMSQATVRWHIGTLMKKLRVTTRAELARHLPEPRDPATPATAVLLAKIPSPRNEPAATPALSGGELKVARLVAQGMTNREIAAGLFISTHTVNSHLKRVYTKLGIRSRVELSRIIVTQEPSIPHRRDSAVS